MSGIASFVLVSPSFVHRLIKVLLVSEIVDTIVLVAAITTFSVHVENTEFSVLIIYKYKKKKRKEKHDTIFKIIVAYATLIRMIYNGLQHAYISFSFQIY